MPWHWGRDVLDYFPTTHTAPSADHRHAQKLAAGAEDIKPPRPALGGSHGCWDRKGPIHEATAVSISCSAGEGVIMVIVT